MEKKKTFDAVAWVRQIRDKHAALLAGSSREERIAFFRERAERLNRELDEDKATERKEKET